MTAVLLFAVLLYSRSSPLEIAFSLVVSDRGAAQYIQCPSVLLLAWSKTVDPRNQTSRHLVSLTSRLVESKGAAGYTYHLSQEHQP